MFQLQIKKFKLNNYYHQLIKPRATTTIIDTRQSRRSISVYKGTGYMEVAWSKDEKSKFHNVWLRDNCQCPKCLHPSTKQKLHSSAQVPLDIKPIEWNLIKQDHNSDVDKQQGGQLLEITWDQFDVEPSELKQQSQIKGQKYHKSVYSLKWLKEHEYSSAAAVNERRLLDHLMITWDLKELSSANLWMDYDQLMDPKSAGSDRDPSLWQFVKTLQTYGLAFIRGVPDELTAVEAIAERFGPIRETFYGRSWDVKSTVDATNIAYTSLFLDLHMDLMYFESPPGIQFLHVLQSSLHGGDSIFTDCFKAVELLRKYHPQDFEILSKVPVTFHYENNRHHLRFTRPTITADDPNHGPYDVYYAPPFQAPLEAPYESTETFYIAFKKFSELLNDPSMTLTRKLEAGDCVVFQNRRVLHGRLAFDAKAGTRHLRGTYVDWDVMMDRFRTLRKLNNDPKKGQ